MPMLTVAHKEARVSWATRHLNDNWDTTLFSDETAFQLFRNTITQWYVYKRANDQSSGFLKIALKSLRGEDFVYAGKLLYFVLEIL